MANTQKFITLGWMSEYTTKIKEYMSNKFYTKSEVDTLLSQIESGSVETVRGTKAEIEAMDLTKYPNGTIFIMEV